MHAPNLLLGDSRPVLNCQVISFVVYWGILGKCSTIEPYPWPPKPTSASFPAHRKVEDLQFRVEEESITKGDLEVTGAVLACSLSSVGPVLAMGNGLGIQAAILDLRGEAGVTQRKNGGRVKGPLRGGVEEGKAFGHLVLEMVMMMFSVEGRVGTD